jgi:GDP-mannose 6-dehydrogenase
MNIAIFGLGYVGCVTGACFAELGHNVTGVEPNEAKLSLIAAGKSPIVEKDLDRLIAANVESGRLRVTNDYRSALSDADLALVCVGTPSRSNGSLETRFLTRVCEQIAEALADSNRYLVVTIRSTVMPGTVEQKLVPMLEKGSGKKAGADFGVCMNPEFLREGSSVFDFHNPPKTVIGQLDTRSGEVLSELYRHMEAPLFKTSIQIAEMVKYVDNSFHALKVAFANEIGGYCKEIGVDSHRVMDIFCSDTKLNLSPAYLKPGFAFGGSCLPKDLRAISYQAKVYDLELPLLGSILESNKRQVARVIKKLSEFKGKRLGFVGLAFKGGTDDLRESPIVEVIEAMLGKGFRLSIYDRNVALARLLGANKEYIESEIPHISTLMAASTEELLAKSDVIVVSIKDKELLLMHEQLTSNHILIDLVRAWDTAPTQCVYVGLSW